MAKHILEIACFNLQSAVIADMAGADRIELCDNQTAGGVTPSKDSYKYVHENCDAEVFVMIRPRPGNFQYSDAEFKTMKSEIEYFKKAECDGFVFGVLTAKNEVDVSRNLELVKLASPLPCTFHRAFDKTSDLGKSLEAIIECGFSRILTSGGKESAEEGASEIAKLVKQAGSRLVILPGGGVRSDNLADIINATGASEFHSAALLKGSQYANAKEIKALLEGVIVKKPKG